MFYYSMDEWKPVRVSRYFKKEKLHKQERRVVCFFPVIGKKKYYMAYLLYRLFNENFAHIKRNRGYFRCAEKMFSDMAGKPYKLNSLKKISYKINKEKSKYLHVTKEVDSIIMKISTGTNGR